MAVRAPSDEGINICVDVFVWHDGAFPFSDHGSDDAAAGANVGVPRVIHHCDYEQFMRFGEQLQSFVES